MSSEVAVTASREDEIRYLRDRVVILEEELRSVRERELSNDEVRLRRLHNVASNGEMNLEQKIQALLTLGLETFGLKIALVSEIKDNVYTVRYSRSLLDPVPVGATFAFQHTYCLHTLKADQPTAFHHVAFSEIRSHPCYQSFGLESYIGAVLWVGGSRYGTLNFSSPDPARPFSERDLVMVELFAQWLGHEIEREHRIAEVNAARTRAEEANAARSAFLATMSHELRAPLSGVLNVLGVLGNTPLNDEQARYVGLLTRTSGAMLTMLNDLLDMAKIEADQLTLETIPFTFHELLADTAELVSHAAKQKGVRLVVDCALTRPRLGDPNRLRQVILNLANNAVKFTAEGRITITVRKHEPDDAVEVKVIDTGIGMTPAQLSRMFKPFSQADSTISRRFGGTGLGLNICKHLVEAMGGEIGVESVHGAGSTFWFRVPLARAACAVGPLAPVAGRRILVADDSVINRFLAQRILEKAGYEVFLAEDGQQALALTEQQQPDLILLDVQMPLIDGITAAGLIRERFGAELPMLSISGADNDHHNDALLRAAGFDGFVPKPFDSRRLIQAIEGFFQPAAAQPVPEGRGASG
ncbi:MAG: ATP-binding protein [Myxococcota bacterium]